MLILVKSHSGWKDRQILAKKSTEIRPTERVCMLPVPGTDYEISIMAESMYKMQRWNNLIAVSKLLAAPIVPVNALALAKYNVSFSSYHHHFKIFIN